VILDGNSLEILATFDLVGNWILSLSMHTTDRKEVDDLIILDCDGFVQKFSLDLASPQCQSYSSRVAVKAHTNGEAIDLQFNSFDPKISYLLEKRFCQVIMLF
jgi:hypothetical protein